MGDPAGFCPLCGCRDIMLVVEAEIANSYGCPHCRHFFSVSYYPEMRAYISMTGSTGWQIEQCESRAKDAPDSEPGHETT